MLSTANTENSSYDSKAVKPMEGIVCGHNYKKNILIQLEIERKNI